jgi:hypothetical protein
LRKAILLKVSSYDLAIARVAVTMDEAVIKGFERV